ncbi:MAG: phytanoyl-CoA dioxygenase family protein [Pseudomonadota bacterium]
MTHPHRPADLPASAMAQLWRDGYLILPNLIAPDEVETIRQDLEPWFARTPRCQGDFYGWATTRFGSVLSKSRATWEMVMHPAILAIMDEVLLPHCDVYQLNLTQGIRIHPGERQQVPHRDQEMFPMAQYPFELLVNVMWALSDYTAENGATRIWPGRHQMPPGRAIDPAASLPAAMPAGSALVYLGSLTHAGGSNRSQAPRTGIIASYCLGWLRQYENQYLAYPPEVARAFPEALQRLIGYAIHRPNLGGYENSDPMEWLRTGDKIVAARDALPEQAAAALRDYVSRTAA